jgi:hypothetical protein
MKLKILEEAYFGSPLAYVISSSPGSPLKTDILAEAVMAAMMKDNIDTVGYCDSIGKVMTNSNAVLFSSTKKVWKGPPSTCRTLRHAGMVHSC